MPTTAYIPYLLLIGAIMASFVLIRKRQQRQTVENYQLAVEQNLTEPPSLHPVIDSALCIGCGSCVKACPEGNVLGVIDKRAQLVNPTHCIGHGACRTACPMQAITLVFGTDTRGVDIPQLNEDFETNVPGIYIAGELGGMGLIRNAFSQGAQAVEAIAKKIERERSLPLDLVIIGAGPSGIAASLKAKQLGLNYLVLEQESLGGTIAHYPRGKVVMTAPAQLPLVGRVPFTLVAKEQLLEFIHQVSDQHRLQINHGERMEHIAPDASGALLISSSRTNYQAHAVLLCIGRRGTPRTLEVDGESLPKVCYRLVDPEQFQGQKVLVVGGGDSALEAAIALAEQPHTEVTLSYRGESFNRAKEANRKRVTQLQDEKRINLLYRSQVRKISPRSVELEYEGGRLTLLNDSVIVLIGGVLPTPFLKKIGIRVATKYGTA